MMHDLLKTPRGMAVEILNRIESTDAYAEPLLDARLSENTFPNINDRRLITQLVYGVLRTRGRLDWIIRTYYRGNFRILNIFIKNILRTGVYQLLYTDRIPEFAAVNEAVSLAKIHHPKGARLVNAVLRNYLRGRNELVYPSSEEDPLKHVAVVHSHPRWLVKKWLDIFGLKETSAICSANNGLPSATLLVNRWKANRQQAKEELATEGIETMETVFSPDGLVISGHGSSLRETASYKKGHVLLQDEASQLIAYLLAPLPGQRVLDLCAGTGIKTTHLAGIMENKGIILAVDIKEKKLALLRELTDKAGLKIVETKVGDAAADLGVAFHEQFDRVLVDAPCSCLGTLRRNPEIKWRIRARDIKVFSDLQKRILESAAAYIKRGGTLVYSVCTVMPEENETVINDFLRRRPDFHQVPPKSIDGSMIDKQGFFRTSPNRHGMDGFFGAALVRT